MAQSMASSSSLSALRSSSHLQGLQSRASTRTNLPAFYRLGRDRPIGLILRAQQSNPTSDAGSSRRQVIGLVAAGIASGSFVQAVFAEARSIKIGPPPPPSGGLPGTLNSDEARDLEKPLKERFYLQPLSPSEAAQRVKESAKDIVNVKGLIDKKAWPYVQNDLRTKAEYLRYDLKTIISAKPKDQKKSLKELTSKLFDNINNLDYAAKIKSTPQAEKYYAETVSTLNDVLSKLG